MSQTPLISVSDLPDDAVVVDVREDNEWHAGHAPNAIHVPMGTVPESLDKLPDTDETIPVICRSGGRSDRVVQWLVQQGFDVVNVDGGMRAWAAAGKQMRSEDGSEPSVI
ncbi:rhodanese-like domain-containing protein [Ornithinimicrobium faecis]|uniref:Rhodanese-like domain-containing protein n=1 Tax=Ornithinimicrobium faecis TaxID=2934158 RepID=A0ABY4YVP5_9MICO|nr:MULTISPECIES: rhodanese-like domain-containing protein [unclassified Ornithinimicrobium]USQ80232.1 rhodanese-like domain-containing protein [Ornithinimicrobium sp. HY1793]